MSFYLRLQEPIKGNFRIQELSMEKITFCLKRNNIHKWTSKTHFINLVDNNLHVILKIWLRLSWEKLSPKNPGRGTLPMEHQSVELQNRSKKRLWNGSQLVLGQIGCSIWRWKGCRGKKIPPNFRYSSKSA